MKHPFDHDTSCRKEIDEEFIDLSDMNGGRIENFMQMKLNEPRNSNDTETYLKECVFVRFCEREILTLTNSMHKAVN